MSTYTSDVSNVEFDLLVIGAGINGAAIARDAAMRGLRVLLVDKDDVGAGTTSWSTRLIHGGLRYLEHMAVPLVRESLHERKVLLETAPHLVHPLHFLIPVYEAGARRGGIIRLGMVAYEVLSFDKSVGRYQMLGPQETLQRAPGLDPEGLRGGALYYDAQAIYPERLALENTLSAREHGAFVLTYTKAESFEVSGDRVRAVHLRDVRSGRRSTARAAMVLNAAGPWADDVLRGFPQHRDQRLIGGTKGSHLVVGPFPGAPSTALYTEATDNRPYFIVPWAGNFLIGTTDTRFEGDVDDVAASDEEIDYLVRSTNQVIPAAGLDADAVLWTYAGVRPLPYEPDVPERKVTRKHVFRRDEKVHNFVSVVGGKLTTHRALAEQGVDLVFETLRRKSPRCRTAQEPLPGGRAGDWPRFADGFREFSGLPTEVANHLLDVYGVRATDVLGHAGDDSRLHTELPGTTTLAAEIPFAVRGELATTLSDIYLRRTMLGVRGDLGLGTLDAATELAQARLGWSSGRAQEEIANYQNFLARYHRGRVPSTADRRD